MTIVNETGQLEFVFDNLEFCFEKDDVLRVSDENNDVMYFALVNGEFNPVFAFFGAKVYENNVFGWKLKTKGFIHPGFNIWSNKIRLKVYNAFENDFKNFDINDIDFLGAFKGLLNDINKLQLERDNLYYFIVNNYGYRSVEFSDMENKYNHYCFVIDSYLDVLGYLEKLYKGFNFN